MAAYAAVVSLKHTIDSVFCSSHLSPESSTGEILEFAFSQITTLQEVLTLQQLQQRFDNSSGGSSKKVDVLEGQIRDAANKLEDVLELYELDQLYSEWENNGDEDVNQEIASFLESLKKMEQEYLKELRSPVQEDDGDDGDCVSLYIDFGVEMVGHQAELIDLRNDLLARMRPTDMCFVSYVGEAGTGRSLISRAIFEEERQCFDCGAWVTIGDKYQQYKGVAICILDQVIDHDKVGGDEYKLLLLEEDERICNYLYKTLEHQRYMIYLDDVRDVQVMDYLRRSFPDQSNGSLVFLTTNQMEIAESVQCVLTFTAHASYIEECSWYFLKLALFGIDASISPELEEAGKEINGNCRGRYMVLAKTLLFLLKTEKTVEEWRKIAADKENPIFMVEDELSELCKIKTEMKSHNWDLDDPREEVDAVAISWINYSAVKEEVKKKIHPERFFSKMQIIYLVGMAGIGKTTYANKLIQDESVLCYYDHCVWVNLGPKYQAEEILIDILAQIYPNIDKMRMKEDENNLVKDLCVQLSSKRCLLIIDDLWSKAPLDHLKRLLPDINGRALVTTRTEDAIIFNEDDIFCEIRFLDTEESWCLLCQKVFGGRGLCPSQLEKAARKIAENCDGLPLLILTVADQLLKVGDMSEEYWEKVASGKEKSVFKNAHDKISKALLPSYKCLPQHLKVCFLYLGIFRERYEISTSKFTNLLIYEGFLVPDLLETTEYFIAESLTELIKKRVMLIVEGPPGLRMKRCRLHSVFWHLCNSEVAKNKLFHAMNSYDDCWIENLKNLRRLCIRNSNLLGFKDVQESMASITSAHSLLCVSAPHQYPVPITFDFRLLRVMDALAIRQYEFPVEVVKLLHLRFLTITCCGKLPTAISNLWKLQHLTVSRYMHTKSADNSLLLPMEIWDMKELKHLQIMGGRLPNPKCGAGLDNLSALLDVSAESCTQEVLEMIPNLRRLGIRIELAPDDDGNSFDCLNNISSVCGLKSLKCVVVNPQFSSKMAPPPAPVSMFPSSLIRLSLSGSGYPWEYMSLIAGLENLEVLKLKSYAFRGPKWEISRSADFEKLKFLSIEDTDLVHWELKLPILKQLECLSIKHCYKLRELPTSLPSICFSKMEIVDCNPMTLTWANQMRKRLATFPFEAHFSWHP